MSLLRTIGLSVSILGTLAIGVYGFPVSRMAMRENLTCKECVRRYSALLLLLAGFVLQLIAEICPCC